MAATSSSPQAILMAMGGYRDPFALVPALASMAVAATFNTVTSGATAVNGGVYLVMDGSQVTAPASPATNNAFVVLSATPALNCTVAPASGGSLNGVTNGTASVGQVATVFTYNGTTWVPSQ